MTKRNDAATIEALTTAVEALTTRVVELEQLLQIAGADLISTVRTRRLEVNQ